MVDNSLSPPAVPPKIYLKALRVLLIGKAQEWMVRDAEVRRLWALGTQVALDTIKDRLCSRFPGPEADAIPLSFSEELSLLKQKEDESLTQYYERGQALISLAGIEDAPPKDAPESAQLTGGDRILLNTILETWAKGLQDSEVRRKAVKSSVDGTTSLKNLLNVTRDAHRAVDAVRKLDIEEARERELFLLRNTVTRNMSPRQLEDLYHHAETMSSSKDVGSGVPASSKGSWATFLKSIASFNGDLSSLTAPPFIISSTSLVEFSAYWAEHPSLLVAPSREQDPQKRALLVLKWFLSTLHQQYCSRSEKLGSEKKPLNPFLGELYLGKWADDGDIGDTLLYSEQVNHHPPVTAYTVENKKHGVQLQGYNAQKASFSNTINVKQIGHALLSFPTPGSSEKETYLISLPSLHIESLIYGTPFVELNKSTYIASSTGYMAKIDYSGRGWVSGKKNSFNAILYKHSEGEKRPLYTVDGQWSESFVIKDASSKKEVDRFDVKKSKTSAFTISPIEEQDIYESRRAWKDVAAAVEKGDMDALSAAKSKIENAQRELRKVEAEEGREWERRFFQRINLDGNDGNNKENETFKKLLKMAGLDADGASSSPSSLIDSDKTGGVWRFDASRAEGAKSPYHADSVHGVGLAVNTKPTQ
ncbi:KES1 [Arthroderma uncinatum]|uniref:KES1 n=1 Tax=Arthroderma uncinatum TaxID=74035 RepID=UPI00144A9408|nr:KES1 [Arthroderma uncinatum]KAF3483814.1 KES1 [Arthroderma uncinatum]